MSIAYYETLAKKMADIPVDHNKGNLIFTDGRGGYTCTYVTEDEMLDSQELFSRIDTFNNLPESLRKGKRCIMASKPNWLLRDLGGYPTSMVTVCADMKEEKKPQVNIKAGGFYDPVYNIPDRRDEALRQVLNNTDLKALAERMTKMNVEVDGKKAFEGVPYYPQRLG